MPSRLFRSAATGFALPVAVASAALINTAAPAIAAGHDTPRVKAGVPAPNHTATATLTATPTTVNSGDVVTFDTGVTIEGEGSVAISHIESDRYGWIDPINTSNPDVVSASTNCHRNHPQPESSSACAYKAKVRGTPGSTVTETVHWYWIDDAGDHQATASVQVKIAGTSTTPTRRTPADWAPYSQAWPALTVGSTSINRWSKTSLLWPSLPSACTSQLPWLQEVLVHQALAAPCDAPQRLVKAATAAVLNEAASPATYPSSSVSAIRTRVNTELASGNRSTMIQLAYLYETWNGGR